MIRETSRRIITSPDNTAASAAAAACMSGGIPDTACTSSNIEEVEGVETQHMGSGRGPGLDTLARSENGRHNVRKWRHAQDREIDKSQGRARRISHVSIERDEERHGRDLGVSGGSGMVTEGKRVKADDAVDKGAKWIVKPSDSSRGRGIYLLRELGELAYDQASIIQRYISDPLTVGGYKADLRL